MKAYPGCPKRKIIDTSVFLLVHIVYGICRFIRLEGKRFRSQLEWENASAQSFMSNLDSNNMILALFHSYCIKRSDDPFDWLA